MISKKNRKKLKKKSNKRQKGGNRCVKTENLVKMLCKESNLEEAVFNSLICAERDTEKKNIKNKRDIFLII